MRQTKLLQSKRKGLAVPMALIAVILLLTIGMSIITLGLNARFYAIRTTSDIASQCAADAGLTKARFEMNQKIQGNSWFGDDLPSEMNIDLPNCNASFNYTVSVNPAGDYFIESTGFSGQNQRTVSCNLEKRGPFDAAIFSNGFITLHNSSLVDWYYSTGETSEYTDLKIGTNSTEEGDVELKNSAVVNGDVVVGHGGDPDEVIDLKNNAVIEGETSSLTQERELLPPAVPEWLQNLPSGGTIKNNTTILSSGKYDGIDLKNSKTITVTSDVELYITGDIVLGNSAELVIEEDASLTLFLGGDLIAKNSSQINNQNEIPKNLQIYGLEGCTELDLRNSSNLYGVIYTPDADITIHNSGTIYGSAVCNTFDMRNSGTFMYDASLIDEELNAAPVELVVTNWSED